MEKPRSVDRGFFFRSSSILPDWVELIRQLEIGKSSFVMWELWSYPQVRGVDSPENRDLRLKKARTTVASREVWVGLSALGIGDVMNLGRWPRLV
jgi:hypothetical protein